MGQEIEISETQYAIESNNLLKEINSIDKNNLSIQLLILEDTENELLDEYNPLRAKDSESWFAYILEVWRTKIRIDCIRQRMNMYESEMDGLLSQLSKLGLEK
jgi:predicted nucleotidyltransferase